MKIIAFTGMPFSGKSEAVKVAQQLGMPIVRMGDCVWKEVQYQGLPLNDKHVGQIASDMRKQFGNDIWAKKTVDVIKKMSDTSEIIIDGIRNIDEVRWFKKKLSKDFILIAIHTSEDIRHQRGLARSRKDDSKNLDGIRLRDKRELDWGLEKVILAADIVLNNNGDLKNFQNSVKLQIKSIHISEKN